jgi:hypothetical protein
VVGLGFNPWVDHLGTWDFSRGRSQRNCTAAKLEDNQGTPLAINLWWLECVDDELSALAVKFSHTYYNSGCTSMIRLGSALNRFQTRSQDNYFVFTLIPLCVLHCQHFMHSYDGMQKTAFVSNNPTANPSQKLGRVHYWLSVTTREKVGGGWGGGGEGGGIE